MCSMHACSSSMDNYRWKLTPMCSSCSSRVVCIWLEGSFWKHFIEMMTLSGCKILAVCVALVKSKKKMEWLCNKKTVHKDSTPHKPPYSVFIQIIYKAKNNNNNNNNNKGIRICNMYLALSLSCRSNKNRWENHITTLLTFSEMTPGHQQAYLALKFCTLTSCL